MIEQIIIILAILSFLVIGFLIKKGQIKTFGDFSISRDKLSWFPIAAGISMTYAGGAALLNMASLGHSFKWQGMVDPLGLIGGIIIVIFFIKRYRQDKGVTISDLLSGSNKKLSILIGFITTFVFTLILASQFVALSKILVPYFPNINHKILTVLPSALIFSYVFVGGFGSVTKTDILQLCFIGAFLILPILYFVSSETNISTSTSPEFIKMPLNLMILLGISLIYLPVSQDINIRVKSAKNSKQAIIGLLAGACLYTLIIATSTFIGITLAKGGIELNDTEQAFPIFFKEYFPKFGVIAILAALAAIISSLDSFSLNAITSLSNDILNKFKSNNNRSQASLIKISALIIFIISIGIALWFNEILTLVLTALLIYISTLLPIALARKLSIKDNYIFISSILLIIIIAVIELTQMVVGLKAIVYPLVGFFLIGVSFIIQSLIISKK